MRKIDKIIIHCSATPEHRNVSVEDLRREHIQNRGFKEIGYHYIITLDGEIHKGRPEYEIGAHALGHNANSIGVCYIGGVEENNVTKPKDTRTPEQRRSLIDIVKRLQASYPNATVHGHNEFANKACPSFNVQDELYTFQLKTFD